MSVWWFSVNENNVLLFKTRDVSREVISVKPDDCTVLITAADKVMYN